MHGFFGGDLEHQDGASTERVAPAVAEALRSAPPREPLPAAWEALAGVAIVTFDVTEDGAVRHGRSLADAPSLAEATGRAVALSTLARAAEALAVLHGAEACHGDLGGDAIRVLDGGVAILVPGRRLPAGALLAARLRTGGSPTLAAFSAPEVVTGYEATAASDVYAIAALAHEIITGRAPLGQIDFDEARQGPFARIAPLLARGLAASPLARPPARALAEALREAAEVARRLEAAGQAGPYRGSPAQAAPPRARSSAEASAQRQQASSMSGILVLMLVVGGLFVFMGAVWLVGVTWSALDGGGRSFLLFALTSGVLGAGVGLGKKGYAGSGRALLVLGVELLWADGAYLLDNAHAIGDPSGWTMLAGAMTLLAFVLAGALDSLVFASLAAAHYVIFAICLGVALETGSHTGPAYYALATAAGASVIAAVGNGWRRERIGVPFAVVAGLSALASMLVGLVLLDDVDHQAFGAAWPYLVFAVAAAATLSLRAPYSTIAAVAAGATLVVAPTTEAMIKDTLPYLLGGVAVGFGVLLAAFTWPRLSREPSVQLAWVLVGLVSAVTAPSIQFLSKCWDKDGFDALTGPSGVYLGLVVAVPAALIAASYALGRRAQRKTTYRMLELAGLSMFFGTFTLESIARYNDAFYPVVILLVGTAALLVGATTKRATLVLLASVALLLNLAIQYFAKLWSLLPASLLVLVFGLMLLGAGVLYERRLKHLLPGLREWA